MITTVTRQQYFTAVSQIVGMNTLYQGLTITTDDPAWVEFWSAKYIQQDDPVYVQTQLALGFTSAQMLALFDAAVQVPL